MRNWLPGAVELSVFATVAFLCAALVASVRVQDIGLSLVAMPLFVGCALLGMWRAGRLAPAPREVPVESAEPKAIPGAD
jgi:hypothetical protein